MSQPKNRLDDYVDVAERIQAFKHAHPDGVLRDGRPWEIREIGEHTFIVYYAIALRDGDDKVPGQGVAWEPFPGKTPFTKDSELMNAQTAAWGRAIASLGFEVRKGIATKQDVKNRQEADNGKLPQRNPISPETTATSSLPQPVPEKRAEALYDLWKHSAVEPARLGLWLVQNGSEDVDAGSEDSLAKAISALPSDKADALEAKLREKAAA